MWRLVVVLHQACDAKCVGRQSRGRLESRCSMCERPQKGVTCCGRQMMCVVDGGHGHDGEIVDTGACDMMIRDES